METLALHRVVTVASFVGKFEDLGVDKGQHSRFESENSIQDSGSFIIVTPLSSSKLKIKSLEGIAKLICFSSQMC